jgi:hypothetical protein
MGRIVLLPLVAYEKPKDLMVGTGMNGGGWHPSEIGEDIGLGLELLPLDGLLGTEHSCAVFGLEPWAYLMGGDGGDELAPFAEAAEVALVIDEETCHVLLDAVHLAGGKLSWHHNLMSTDIYMMCHILVDKVVKIWLF